jgi:hypothetical protein
MNYEASQEIIQKFRKAFPELLMRRDIHGVYVGGDDQNPVITLLSSSAERGSDLRSDEVTPAHFAVNLSSGHVDLMVQEVESERFSTHAFQGEKTSYSALLNPYGTAGWNVFLSTQNIWVCLSCHHVMVDPDNSHAGIDIFFESGLHEAVLHAMVNNETWDYAIARYVDSKDATRGFRPCQDNQIHSNPQRFAEDIARGDKCRKVGARSPVCRSGKFKGFGDFEVVNNLARAWKRGQLIFDVMSAPGDSGSIIAKEKDNTVVGLLFSGTKDYTLANPLYKIGWSYIGTLKLASGDEVPVYDESESVVPTWPTSADTRKYRHTGVQSLQGEQNSVNFLEGKYFLGVAVHEKNLGLGGREQWLTPIPPPIRPEVKVDAVLFKETAETHGDRRPYNVTRQYYMCFG